MNEISKYWVMIPVGFQEEHKEAFVDNILKINPNNDAGALGVKWDMLQKMGVLQIVIDVRDGSTVCSMVTSQIGTSWQISKHILKNITNINNFDPEALNSSQYNEKDEMIYENEYSEPKENTIKFDVDELLDIISDTGYESLSEDQKEYLKSLKK